MKSITKALLFLLILPLLLWAVVIVFKLQLSLPFLNAPLSAAVSESLNRQVEFAGDIRLTPTLLPRLEVSDVSIANPADGSGHLLHFGRILLQLDLVNLLSRDIVVEDFVAEQVSLGLERDLDGRENWRLRPAAELVADEEGDEAIVLADTEAWSISADIRRIKLRDISVSYRDELRNTELLFELDQLDGHMRWDADIYFEGNGLYQQQPWTLTINAGALKQLLRRQPGWQIEVATELSGLMLDWTLTLQQAAIEARLQLSGENLATLSPVTGFAMPEWGPYAMSAYIAHTRGAHKLDDLQIRIGKSEMRGDLELRMAGEIPELTVELASKRLQIDDFLDSSAARNNAGEGTGTEQAAPDTQARLADLEAFLEPAFLEGFAIDFGLGYDEILSGEDRLGSGRLKASAGGNRIRIEEWQVNLPAGVINLSTEIVREAPGYRVSTNIDIENADYGVIARRKDPESNLKGLFDLRLDLQSSTPSLDQIMMFGNGHLDFAVWPEEFKSGAIDLWAVGLLNAALSQFESKSLVNCVVARFDLEQGVLRERALMFDTSEIRVLGDAVIDIPARTVDILMVPSSKKPQLISAAVPISLSGSFEEFKPGIAKSDVAYSVVRSGVNIALLGIPLLFHETLEADGSEDCRAAMTQDFALDRQDEPGAAVDASLE